MNNWLKIGVPVLIALLLITATVGVTLAVTGKGAVVQGTYPAPASAQATDGQYARGPLCSACPGYDKDDAAAGGQENSTANSNVASGATSPSCHGYVSNTPAQTSTSRGGCCGGR